MRLADVLDTVNGKAITTGVDPDMQVTAACGADLMSDVLAFTHSGTLLLTGLTNPQVVRTAEMAGIRAVLFVRGKVPPPETISLAQDMHIPLTATRLTMYEACGLLYGVGLESCGLSDLSGDAWRDAFGEERES